MRIALILILLASCSLSREEQCKRWADRQCACALELRGNDAWQNELQREPETISMCMEGDYTYSVAKHCTRADTCREFMLCYPPDEPDEKR